MKKDKIKKDYLEVSEATSLIKKALEGIPQLKNVWLCGEVSGYKKQATSGHIYFNLKDEKSQIQVIIFSWYAKNLRYKISDGDKIKVFGSLSLYEKGGRYTFRGQGVLPFGEGELFLKFQLLKKKLEKEGLFSPEHKKKLPLFPHRIALITSKTGATLHDMLRVIRQKNKVVDILIIPALVQGGEEAAISIKSAIELANFWSKEREKIDLIILARGGGSLEDLWVFNMETVARAIFASELPIITGIGHDPDFTIADYVADKRAATPTAAAEKAVPDIAKVKKAIEDKKFKLIYFIEKKIAKYQKIIERFEWVSRDLEGRLEKQSFYVGNLLEKAKSALEVIVEKDKHRLDKLTHYLRKLPELKLKNISFKRKELFNVHSILEKNIFSYLEKRKRFLLQFQRNLRILSPHSVLSRGYSLVWDEKREKICRKVEDISENQNILIQLQDGYVKGKVKEKGER